MFVLGTAGHIDHGKTALIRLLTGCETDRLREEKERGITIEEKKVGIFFFTFDTWWSTKICHNIHVESHNS